MNELIKYFNNKYSKTYGKIAYPRTTIQIYRVYQAIKSYGINDDKLVELLHDVKLPKPRNTEEWELYVYCLYNMDDSELEEKIKDVPKKTIVEDNKLYLVKSDGTKIGEGTELPSTNISKEYVDNSLKNKVDKINGKGLSTVDFTTAYETKLKKLENYNDTTIKKDIQTINTQLGDIAKKVEQGGSIDLTDYAKKNEIPKSASDVGADATGTATTKVTEHNTSNVSHNDIRLLITNLTNKLNALADSDDTTLDQLSEIVTYIKNNKSLIDGITTSKLNISDVADNLTTNITNKALSAKQGVELKKLIDAITVPTKVSQLTNDSKFLTSVPAEYITEDELNTKGYLTKHQDISGKVDKVEGKGLSTVDFTTAYETKLKGLSNYNDTIIKNNIDAINAKINTMFSFNDNGELVVTIGEVSKTFVPKSE